MRNLIGVRTPVWKCKRWFKIVLPGLPEPYLILSLHKRRFNSILRKAPVWKCKIVFRGLPEPYQTLSLHKRRFNSILSKTPVWKCKILLQALPEFVLFLCSFALLCHSWKIFSSSWDVQTGLFYYIFYYLFAYCTLAV